MHEPMRDLIRCGIADHRTSGLRAAEDVLPVIQDAFIKGAPLNAEVLPNYSWAESGTGFNKRALRGRGPQGLRLWR